MFENLIVPLLFSLLIYLYLPTPETNLLVIFSSSIEDLDRRQIEEIGNVKHAFKIIRNVDGHMKHVEIESKLAFNYAIVTDNLKEKEMKTFEETIKHQKFIKTFEIFPFKTNPVRHILVNLFLKTKGLFLSKSLTPSSNKLDLENMESLCSELNFQDKTPKVMINVISIKPEGGEAEMEKYSSTCVFDLFPRIGSFIFYAGKSLSDYWDMIALMQYESYESLCKMVESEEYLSVYQHKVDGLRDTHTYLTQPIF